MRTGARLVGAAVVLGALGLTGCGGAGPAPAATPPAASPAAPPAASSVPSAAGASSGHGGHPAGAAAGPVQLYAVQTGPLGTVATDGGGRLLYRSDADSAAPPISNCVGACAATWHPLLTAPGQEPELLGVDPAVVGRLQRPDGGTQLTLDGWPLYVRGDDPGDLATTGANGADGTWFVVTPTGAKAAP
jgi:predicted lipoprotein with Yx(FWY)xxD motif